MSPRLTRAALSAGLAALFAAVSLSGLDRSQAAPGSAPASEQPPAVVRGHLDAAVAASGPAPAASGPGSTAAADSPDAGRVALKTLPENVTIIVRSSPHAFVRWGGTALGDTPLTLVRKRESGPLDLTLSAGGYLSTHVRAYTFNDETLNVRLVRESDKQNVFGYPVNLDAGVPAPSSEGGFEGPPMPAPAGPPTGP